jgi:hypothetical protein
MTTCVIMRHMFSPCILAAAPATYGRRAQHTWQIACMQMSLQLRAPEPAANCIVEAIVAGAGIVHVCDHVVEPLRN